MLRYHGDLSEIECRKYKLLMLGIYQSASKRFLFNPIGNTLLESGDMLIIVGDYVFIEEFKKHLHKKS